MRREVRVGIVDSGIRARHAGVVKAAKRFRLDAELQLGQGEAEADRLGHGSAVLETICQHAPNARFCIAQVFHDRWHTTPLQIAAAMHWLIDQEVNIINLSLGVRTDRLLMRDACMRAQEAGILLCAACPAQGLPVFPASYPNVLRVTGDARCGRGQWSWLGSAQADFGAVVSTDPRGPAGASIACAAISGTIAALMQAGVRPHELLAHLKQHAAFVGIERKRLA
ncbi:S8 family peptidase [Cupriavidus basilensis]|uniref:S8 family serine peptidase n=1 Tax=Cupriavidus basilensis TaxID=68895 RepID=A0A643FKT8_9BURK|nr:S8 family serine peptidase [Cupriavidus basilensis]QOT82041.1 S8 family serine peptidase [Cupriavidus basilensis]